MLQQGCSIGPRILAGPRIEVIPGVVPTELTLVVPFGFHVLEVEFVNNTGSSSIVEIQDGVGQPWTPPTELFDKSVFTAIARYGRWMGDGLQWSSSQPGVIGQIIGIKSHQGY